MRDTRIYCPVTRHYYWLIKPFIYCWDKYFGKPITFISDLPIPDLPLQHSYVPMPAYCRHFYQDPFCRMVKEVFKKFSEPLAILAMPDYWLNTPVNRTMMNFMIEYALHETAVARLDLCIYESGETVKMLDGQLFLTRVMPLHSQLGATSGLLALWRSDFIQEFMEDSWTFADWELTGQKKMIHQSRWFSVTPSMPPMSINHACYTAKPYSARIAELNSEDQAAVIPYVPPAWRIGR